MDDLDPHKCTIYIYAFAKLDPTTYKMDVFDSWLDVSLKVGVQYLQDRGVANGLCVTRSRERSQGWRNEQLETWSTVVI